MAVIGFLSMWLANIATCAMMIPIAAAVLDELNAHRLQKRDEERQKRRELNCLAVFGLLMKIRFRIIFNSSKITNIVEASFYC